MSLDYQDYLRIREKSRVLGCLWQVGDVGYYVGVLGVLLTLSAGTVELIAWVTGIAEREDLGVFSSKHFPWIVVLLVMPLSLVTFFASVYLKSFAHHRASIPAEETRK